uniref:Gamma-interferon-inducible lysosomal thiol reductase n=1 Tax=Caenorhabditis japonica TaxID=281687 RepID=A0A8R1DUC1_CAEJA
MLAIISIASLAALTTAEDLVEVWGIAKCPDTTKFVRRQLLPFYNSFDTFPDDFKLEFHAVPAHGKTVNGTYINHCLHGAAECALNKLQMCSKKYIEQDSLVTIGCIQGKKKYKVRECAESQEGEHLLNDENAYRYHAAPNSAWIPWIQINGVRVQDAEKNLWKRVCELESMAQTEQCKNF